MVASPSTLILIPTEGEFARLKTHLPHGVDVEICGFGPIAGAATTASALARRPYRAVILLGIAGTLDRERNPPGSAGCFRSCVLDGLGAAGLSSAELGFPQSTKTTPPTFDVVPPDCADQDAEVLTVLDASATPEMAARRQARFPGARVEEMEGFGVALAATLAGIPFHIVRGISNVAGERDPARWVIGEALFAAAQELERLLDEGMRP